MSKLFKNFKLSESYREYKPLVVDRDAGVIRGVKIIGMSSLHNRDYPIEVLAKAKPLYEGAKVYIDHPDKSKQATSRSYRDGFGELRNVTEAADGLRGDLHYNRKHALAEQVAEDAERFPKQFGLSQNADGSARKNGKRWVVESIDEVFSVDVVGRPATNKGLFESADEPQGRRRMKVTIRSLVESVEDGSRKTIFTKRLTEMSGDMAAVADAPIEAPEGGEGDDQIESAFISMAVAALSDKSLDVAAKLAKIKLILQSQDKLMNGTAPAADSTDTEKTPATEGKAGDIGKLIEAAVAKAVGPLQEQVESGKLERLLEAAGVTVTADRLKALKAVADEGARSELIEGWKPSGRTSSGKPRPQATGRKTPLTESDDSAKGAESARRAFGIPASATK